MRARRSAWRSVPTNQLVMLKLLCNQTAENMGLASSRTLGTLFDGIARHTQEGLDFVQPRRGGRLPRRPCASATTRSATTAAGGANPACRELAGDEFANFLDSPPAIRASRLLVNHRGGVGL